MISLSIFILGLTVATPDEILVHTVTEFTEAVQHARPGDTIIMANGIWHDADLIFDADGTVGDSITVRAESPGHVILTGQSRLRIGGSYLKVEGLWFHRGALERGHVIAFRTNRPAHHSRVTNCAVTEYNPPNWLRQYKWLSLYGTHNRVDHCYFAGKTHDGATLVVWLENPPHDTPNHHRIDHNHFGPRPELGKNGGETIRIGTSHRSMQDSHTVVEHNLFKRTNGEHEIISNKSGRNIYRHNTFREAQGALTLRHGNRATITQNYFLGMGQPNTGGVRIIGEDHEVTDNYFADLEGDSSRASLSVMNGIPNSPLNRYFQVKRPLIARNTFINTRVSILFGLGADSEKTLLPEDVAFRDNVIFTDTNLPVVSVQVSPDDITWSGNVFFGSDPGITQPYGIQWENPELAYGEDGLWHPSPEGPAYGKGASLARPPLTQSDVGPAWWTLPWTPKVLEDTVHFLPDFSYAGYWWGEQPLPVHETTLVVTDFGATGDDRRDDTEAFLQALAAAHIQQGLVVIGIPKGQYYLSNILLLERDSLIVRGSGIGETQIFIEKPLGAIDVPPALVESSDTLHVQGRRASPFSQSGGVFWSRAPAASLKEPYTPILDGKRGTHTIRVADPEVIDIPGNARISWTPAEDSEIRERNGSPQHIQDVLVIARDGNVIYIKEPLLVDLNSAMQPRMVPIEPLNEIGVEDLTVEFESVPYGGHNLEDGYNAIYLTQVRHGWIRNVEIRNSDAGIILRRSSQVTLDNILITGRDGHVGIHLIDTRNTLVRDVRIYSDPVHPLGCSGYSGYNVFTGGTASHIFDANCVYPNLYDHFSIDGDHSSDGVWDVNMDSPLVLWNTTVQYQQAEAIRLPAYLGKLGKRAMVVGLNSTVPVRLQLDPATYSEGTNRPGMAVPSLYQHQLQHRLSDTDPQ